MLLIFVRSFLLTLKHKIMKANMGILDKIIRFSAAAIIIGLYYAGIFSGALAVGLLVVAIAFIATSFMSFCPLYLPFNISTKN
jgi:hypothetical protein